MMTYEEWLKSMEFRLRIRYKVKDIVIDEKRLTITFANNFNYWTSVGNLKTLWQMDGFIELCNDIEREFMCQIVNVFMFTQHIDIKRKELNMRQMKLSEIEI